MSFIILPGNNSAYAKFCLMPNLGSRDNHDAILANSLCRRAVLKYDEALDCQRKNPNQRLLHIHEAVLIQAAPILAPGAIAVCTPRATT